MDGVKTSSISLRVASKTLTISQISKSLNLQPSKSYEKGEIIHTKTLPIRKREEALWLYDLNLDETLPLEKHIKSLLEILKDKSKDLGEIQNSCDVEIFCSYSTENGQGGFVLNHDLLNELSSLNIDIVFDIYAM